MEIREFLSQVNYQLHSFFKHNDIILSELYLRDNDAIVVDRLIICDIEFSYKRYCQKQNEWMRNYTKVYRFLEDDYKMAELFLKDNDKDYTGLKTMDRELLSIDPSPLEYIFEKCFEEAYNREAYQFLLREYGILLKTGNMAYIDYALFKKNGGWIAIEENGISYHHPYLIKCDKYRHILNKQNSVINNNGIIYRWDTESIQNIGKIVVAQLTEGRWENIRSALGCITCVNR